MPLFARQFRHTAIGPRPAKRVSPVSVGVQTLAGKARALVERLIQPETGFFGTGAFSVDTGTVNPGSGAGIAIPGLQPRFISQAAASGTTASTSYYVDATGVSRITFTLARNGSAPLTTLTATVAGAVAGPAQGVRGLVSARSGQAPGVVRMMYDFLSSLPFAFIPVRVTLNVGPLSGRIRVQLNSTASTSTPAGVNVYGVSVS